MTRAQEIHAALEQYADPEKREVLPRFFKTGKGEYGEGDMFIGVAVPSIRTVAKMCKEEPLEVVEELLHSEWHECRLCALLMLVERFKKANSETKKLIFDFYLAHTDHINNWDLVDLSAPAIVGNYLADKPRDILYILAADPLLWNRRIAIVSTLTFIRQNDFIDTLRLAELFLEHTLAQQGTTTSKTSAKVQKMHDLMQKAIGWMLREVGKRDKDTLICFLERHAQTMPRTMLRYSIEKFPDAERKAFMRKDKAIE